MLSVTTFFSSFHRVDIARYTIFEDAFLLNARASRQSVHLA